MYIYLCSTFEVCNCENWKYILVLKIFLKPFTFLEFFKRFFSVKFNFRNYLLLGKLGPGSSVVGCYLESSVIRSSI